MRARYDGRRVIAITGEIRDLDCVLYLISIYLMGALGAEYVVRLVNGGESPWKTCGRLAFTGAFTAYIFLSQLAYFLRALELIHHGCIVRTIAQAACMYGGPRIYRSCKLFGISTPAPTGPLS